MRLHSRILGLIALAALGGCQMLDSRWLDADPVNAGTTCHTNAGTYHLPRRLIRVRVTNSTVAPAPPVFGLNVDVTSAPYVADRTETYCLDFLLSYLSADRVGIQRTADGLLQRVYTQADDKSKGIAQDVIQAAGDLVAANQAESLARSGARSAARSGARVSTVQITTGDPAKPFEDIVARFEFDPFVEREAREVNTALREFGYCVYLDPRNDPFVPPWSEELCRTLSVAKKPYAATVYPMVYKADPAFPRSGLPIFDPRPVPAEVQARGILYRPELSHSLVVMRKPDPGARNEGWRMAASERIVVPNAAPAFVLQVERAIFVKAQTDVQFSNGLIKNISVDKPSELLAAADLAVAAAQVVTNIPAQALKILSNRKQNTIALINTNAALIQVLRDYKGDVNSEAFRQAQAQAGIGTSLIVTDPSLLSGARTLNTGANPDAARYQECLDNPASQIFSNPSRTCLEIVRQQQ